MATNSYEQVVYPQGIDTFREVFEVDNPENIVHAELLNKAQNAVRAIQTHVLYTAVGPETHAPVLCVVAQTKVITGDTGSKRYKLRFEVESGVADTLFGGAPFDRDFGVIPAVTGYRVKNGVRQYFRVQCALGPVDETSRSVIVDCVKSGNEWKRGDQIECELLLVKL
jgi:hypothetical protein